MTSLRGGDTPQIEAVFVVRVSRPVRPPGVWVDEAGLATLAGELGQEAQREFDALGLAAGWTIDVVQSPNVANPQALRSVAWHIEFLGEGGDPDDDWQCAWHMHDEELARQALETMRREHRSEGNFTFRAAREESERYVEPW